MSILKLILGFLGAAGRPYIVLPRDRGKTGNKRDTRATARVDFRLTNHLHRRLRYDWGRRLRPCHIVSSSWSGDSGAGKGGDSGLGRLGRVGRRLQTKSPVGAQRVSGPATEAKTEGVARSRGRGPETPILDGPETPVLSRLNSLGRRLRCVEAGDSGVVRPELVPSLRLLDLVDNPWMVGT